MRKPKAKKKAKKGVLWVVERGMDSYPWRPSIHDFGLYRVATTRVEAEKLAVMARSLSRTLSYRVVRYVREIPS